MVEIFHQNLEILMGILRFWWVQNLSRGIFVFPISMKFQANFENIFRKFWFFKKINYVSSILVLCFIFLRIKLMWVLFLLLSKTFIFTSFLTSKYSWTLNYYIIFFLFLFSILEQFQQRREYSCKKRFAGNVDSLNTWKRIVLTEVVCQKASSRMLILSLSS